MTQGHRPALTVRERMVDAAVRRTRSLLPADKYTPIECVREHPNIHADTLKMAWPSFCAEASAEFRRLQEVA